MTLAGSKGDSRIVFAAVGISLLAVLCAVVPLPLAAQTDDVAGVRVDPDAVDRAKTAFIDRMVTEHGFAVDDLAAVFANIQIEPRILETIARPAEKVVPWNEYRDIFLTEKRIAAGVEFWNEHAAQIAAASERYGVAPEMLVAIVGIETFFGQRMGTYRVLDALSTLAFAYPPRATFFASELEAFLLLSRDEGVGLYDALGSYAGAMGAGQFIPSSFQAYAVDADGDGRRDLWQDWADILGSVANYFHVHGWERSAPVAVTAARPAGWSGPEPANSLDLDATVGSLRRLGYTFATELGDDAPATILGLAGDGGSTEYWVGYHNFHVITRYNRSVKYALAAHELSQAILSRYEERAPTDSTTDPVADDLAGALDRYEQRAPTDSTTATQLETGDDS